MQNRQKVYVVDDDQAVRDALGMLIRSVGLNVRSFASATEFLDEFLNDQQPQARRGCLVLDIRMPGMSGLDLQKRLQELGIDLPVIFVTGHGDVPMAVRAMRSGAVDFLLKPFHDQELLDRIQQSLALDSSRRRDRNEQRQIEERISALTPRENEVLELVVEGLTNKVIANRLHLSQRTVELHRAKVMEKMRATSLAHLVRMCLIREKTD